MKITIAANRNQLRRIATELLSACDADKRLVDVEIDGYMNEAPVTQTVSVGFSNDDMEQNDTLPFADVVLVDVTHWS